MNTRLRNNFINEIKITVTRPGSSRHLYVIRVKNRDILLKYLKKNGINNLIFIDLIEGLIWDQKKIRIQNKEELIKYSYHVAGTVGLMMSKIIGVKHEKAARSAIDLGIVMQLTNIARDVYEDSKMKRIYLPANWIPDISLKNLTDLHNKSSEKDEIISNAIHAVIGLSDKFYQNGFATITHPKYQDALSGSSGKGIIEQLKFQGSHLIYENEYNCTIEEH